MKIKLWVLVDKDGRILYTGNRKRYLIDYRDRLGFLNTKTILLTGASNGKKSKGNSSI